MFRGLLPWTARVHTDQAQLALCMAIIAHSGTPKWTEIRLPEGRTRKAAMHTYAAMRKEALNIPTVAPTENDSATEQPKRKAAAPKKAKASAGDGPKRKPATGRKRKVGQRDDDDEEYMVSKKVKSSTDKGRDEPDEPEVETDQVADDEENA